MELVALLRVMRRRRLMFVPGLLVALAVAAFMLHRAKPSSVTVAWTRVVLDTPKSQVLEAYADAQGSLPWRTSLIVHLLATPSERQQIAARMGVPAYQVTVADPSIAMPQVRASIPQKAADTATIASPYVVTTTMPNAAVQMIDVEAAAPTAPSARRLAAAAVAVLAAHAPHGGHYKSPLITADSDAIEHYDIKQVAPIRTRIIVTNRAAVTAAVAGFFVFGIWSLGVVTLPRLLRPKTRRRAPVLAP